MNPAICALPALRREMTLRNSPFPVLPAAQFQGNVSYFIFQHESIVDEWITDDVIGCSVSSIFSNEEKFTFRLKLHGRS